MRLIFFCAAIVLLPGCGPGPSDSSLTILGFQKQEDMTVVNLELKLYGDGTPLFFSVAKNELPVLSLQLNNGMEVEPDIDATEKLARSCAHISFQNAKAIELTCQVAFKTKKKEMPLNLVYRWYAGKRLNIEAPF